MSNFFQRALRERKKFWDPDIQSEEYHADWSNRERTYLTRKISFFISYALRDAPITPNQVTVFWVILGSAGALFLACPHPMVSLLAIVFLYIAWLLDNVDGELARYNKEFSDEGNFADMVGHQVIFPLVFASLTFRLYLEEGSPVVLALGLLATALVTPLSKMQENVDLLRALGDLAKDPAYLSPEGEDDVIVPIRHKTEKENPLSDLAKKTAGFLFTHCAMLYLLIGAIAFHQYQAYLAFYGTGMLLFFVPKYLARKNELAAALQDNRSLKDDVRPEWLDRNDFPE